MDWERVAIVVAKIEADFVSQIKAGDHIAARTRTTKIGNKSFRLEQDIIDVDTLEVKCRCASVMVLYDLEHHQTMPFGQQKLHEYVRGDLSFFSALAGYNQEEVPSRFPDNIKSIVYALSDSARWWHEYRMEVMKSDKK